MAKNEKDKQKEKGKLSVSRRDFLVTGGAMIAGGALSASSISAAAQRSGSPESRSRESVVGGGPETFRRDGRTKYGKYVTREIIGESKYPQITAPIAKYNGCRGGGNALTCEWSCITRPLVMDDEPEIDNERDQFLLFYSGDLENPNVFGAEIEFSIGEKGKKQIITESTYVWIPKGTKHGLVNFKTIRKPICFMSYYLSPEFSTSWVAPDESMYLAGSSKVEKSLSDSAPSNEEQGYYASYGGRYINRARQTGPRESIPMQFSANLGWPAKVSPMCTIVTAREWIFYEPIHAHRESHQLCLYLGSNPLDIEDIDCEINIFLGKEYEKHVIDTCAMDHEVPGLVHMGDEVRRVGKPIRKFMWVIGPYMDDYFKAASKDKVLLSDESKGEIMIKPDSHDYVPPTKMEDWVWPYPEKKK